MVYITESMQERTTVKLRLRGENNEVDCICGKCDEVLDGSRCATCGVKVPMCFGANKVLRFDCDDCAVRKMNLSPMPSQATAGAKPSIRILVDVQLSEYSLCIYRKLAKSTDGAPIRAEGYLKIAGGLKHFYEWFKEINGSQILQSLHSGSIYTVRPYNLGQFCDGTICSCVTALFMDFCQQFDLSVEEIYRRAYGSEQGSSFIPFDSPRQNRTKSIAGWQGVVYPERWDKQALSGLIQSLTAINNSGLVDVLLTLPQFEGFDLGVGRFVD